MKKMMNGKIRHGQRFTALFNLMIWCLYGIVLWRGTLGWNPRALLRQTTTAGFFVLGVGLEMTLGDFDLCFMAQASVGTLALAVLYRSGVPLPAALILMTIFQCLIGAVRGWISARLQIPMIVSSFAMAQILSNLYAPTDPIVLQLALHEHSQKLQALAAVLLLFCAVGLYFFWEKTYWGKYSMAVGEDRIGAERCGVDTVRVITVVYLLASVLFSLGTVMIFLIAPYGSSSRNADYLYQSLAAACLAGGLQNDSAGKPLRLLEATVSSVMLRQLLTVFRLTSWGTITEGIVILLIFFAQRGTGIIHKKQNTRKIPPEI